ncbi:DUF3566 domain-containing protein [Cellulomonas sp. NS3]|uniref:DUF3566 domain-containing protein n=1 Tax=Cellulomonas sp. NS3 TaxID=2973977 RepID=UPI002163701E|nr:DUF3566 domain-containing protein [Cellulomonas sp. NS3]
MSSESAPPSIPPRKRPTAPATRPSSSTPPLRPAGSAAVDTEAPPAPGAAYADTPSREPVDTPAPRTEERPAPSSTRTAVDPPPPADPEEPSPLQVAVGSVASSLKKAAAKTQAALASAAHPRAEERTMSATATGAQRTVNGQSPRPATGSMKAVPGAPRRVRLALSRVDPWSVMKLAFLLSVAIGIMIVVAAAVVWLTLDGMQVFAKADSLVREVLGAESPVNILEYVEFQRIVSAATLVAVIDVFLITALSTIGAFLYNLTAALVGGVHLTLTDE